MPDKIDQVLEKLEILEKGQKENHSLIQKNGIKIEQVGSDVKAVAEGHQVIRSEMKQMKDELVEKIELVDGKVNFLAQDLKEHLKVPHAV